ncbi:hypothetical protein XU18_1388 [Perkinsela sp. CCAP 1560/4]|nr:hypothetical protein XU18_1388 [Perkinsela sp. CCAP 1560/4]|eukprot:KNH08058.1 hypothetical protein XU18_1388 [Perkinsela sp. CCAP 1560/4]
MHTEFSFIPISKADKLSCFSATNKVAVVRKQTECNIIDFRAEPPKKLFEWIGFSDGVTCIAPSVTNSAAFYCSTKSGKTFFWDPDQREKVCIIDSSSFVRALACFRDGEENNEGDADYLAIGGESLSVFHKGNVRIMQEFPSNSHHIAILKLRQRSMLVTLKDDGSLIVFNALTGMEQARTTVETGLSLRTNLDIGVNLSSSPALSTEYISVPCKGVKLFSYNTQLSEEFSILETEGSLPYYSKFIKDLTLVVGYINSTIVRIYQIDPRRHSSTMLLSVETSILHRFMDCSSQGTFLVSKNELLHCNKNLMQAIPSGQKEKREGPRTYIDDEAEECSENSAAEEHCDMNEDYLLDKVHRKNVPELADSEMSSFLDDSKDDSSHQEATQDAFDRENEIKCYRSAKIREQSLRILHPQISIGLTPCYSGSQYLAFNLYGYVAKQGEQIAVHFHDKGKLPVRLGEQNGVCLASLGENGVLIGSTTSLFYKSFLSFGTNSDWSVHFEPSEEINLLSAGTRNLVVSTSKYLRIYTHSGLEIAVICNPRRVVCMTMSSGCFSNVARDLCAIVYELNEHELELCIYDTSSFTLLERAPLNFEILTWMGWSSDGFFYVVDNKGGIAMLSTSFGGSWIPVYDPLLNADDAGKYWIWGMTEDSFLGHKLLAEEGDYPTFGAVRTEYIRFQLPLSRTGTEKQLVQREWITRNTGKLKEIKANSKCYTSHIAEWDVKIDQVLLDSFRSYIQEDLTAKALEIACCFELQATMDEAILYCHNNERTTLLKKLQQLRQLRHKRKRVCDLPDPGDEISERDKEVLLRRMLYQEKAKRASERTQQCGSSIQTRDSQTDFTGNYAHTDALTESLPETGNTEGRSDASPKKSKYFGS